MKGTDHLREDLLFAIQMSGDEGFCMNRMRISGRQIDCSKQEGVGRNLGTVGCSRCKLEHINLQVGHKGAYQRASES